MKKKNAIKLNFLVNGSLNIYSYYVYIYDSHSRLICCKQSEQGDAVYFDPPYCGIYHIKVIAVDVIPRMIYYSTFYYSGYCCNVLIIFNNFSKTVSPRVTIQISDQYYYGLPITKGEIVLWPDHM